MAPPAARRTQACLRPGAGGLFAEGRWGSVQCPHFFSQGNNYRGPPSSRSHDPTLALPIRPCLSRAAQGASWKTLEKPPAQPGTRLAQKHPEFPGRTAMGRQSFRPAVLVCTVQSGSHLPLCGAASLCRPRGPAGRTRIQAWLSLPLLQICEGQGPVA